MPGARGGFCQAGKYGGYGLFRNPTNAGATV
jgi:hypothetical protein